MKTCSHSIKQSACVFPSNWSARETPVTSPRSSDLSAFWTASPSDTRSLNILHCLPSRGARRLTFLIIHANRLAVAGTSCSGSRIIRLNVPQFGTSAKPVANWINLAGQVCPALALSQLKIGLTRVSLLFVDLSTTKFSSRQNRRPALCFRRSCLDRFRTGKPGRNLGELLQRSLKIIRDFCGDRLRRRKRIGIGQALIFDPDIDRG
jgi:hypothetical protein